MSDTIYEFNATVSVDDLRAAMTRDNAEKQARDDALREEGRAAGIAEGREKAFREAAEVARVMPLMAANDRDLTMKREGAREAAEAIEAKAKEK